MKKRLFSLLLCISMLCGVLSGCGSNKTDSKAEAEETADLFSAYAEFYEEFFEDHKTNKYMGDDIDDDDIISYFEGAGKIILDENDKPMLVIADFVNADEYSNSLIYNVYFYTYDEGNVVERIWNLKK